MRSHLFFFIFGAKIEEMLSTVVENYITIRSSIGKLLKLSGYRTEFVANQMGMDIDSFYLKKKENSFSPEEINRFLEVIKVEEIEEKILAQLPGDQKPSELITEEKKKIFFENLRL